MLRLRRRRVTTHSQLVKKELGESLDHFVQAANHVAGGVGATVAPRVEAARERVAPAAGRMKTAAATGLGTTAAALAVAAKEGARKARRKKPEPEPRRWPRLAMLLAGGAAVGAAAALVLRRRRQQHWEEYDPSRPMEPAVGGSATGAPTGSAEGQHRASRTTATTAEEMADKASSAIDSARSRAAGGESTVPVGGINTAVPGRGLANPVTGLESSSGNSSRSY